MQRHAITMQLKPGAAEEYRRRHDALWPEMGDVLRAAGISGYSIFLDEASGTLFAVMTREDHNTCGDLPNHPVVKRWWAHMADLMVTNDDHSPVEKPLIEVFYLS
jgi:L-rhamnose mutarotase